MLDAKIAPALNKSIQNSYFQEDSLSMWVGSERIPLCASAKEEPDFLGNNAPLTVSTRKTDRLHDLRLLSSDWRS